MPEKEKPFPYACVKPQAKILLDPDFVHVLDKPWVVPCSDFTIDVKGGDYEKPAIIRCRKGGPGDYDAIVLRNNIKNVNIRNVVIDSTPRLRGINNGGTNNHFLNIGITDRTMMALIFMGAKDSTIDMSPAADGKKGFRQRQVTLKGYTYFTGCNNCWLKRVETYGNYYENEHRFHASTNCGIEDLTVYGANPENDVDQNEDGNLIEGKKDNALRLHDGSYTVKKVFGTGNMRLGVMGDGDGGLYDWENAQKSDYSKKQRERFLSEYIRKMDLKSSITFESIEWYGLIRLESNLVLNVKNLLVYIAGGESIIRVDPDYVAGHRRRKAAIANFEKIEAFNVSVSGAIKKTFSDPSDIVNACRSARAKGKFNATQIRSGTAGQFVVGSSGVNKK